MHNNRPNFATYVSIQPHGDGTFVLHRSGKEVVLKAGELRHFDAVCRQYEKQIGEEPDSGLFFGWRSALRHLSGGQSGPRRPPARASGANLDMTDFQVA